MAKKIWKWADRISKVLLVAGGLNWGLVGFGFNPVSAVFGVWTSWVYIAVGLSAVHQAYQLWIK